MFKIQFKKILIKINIFIFKDIFRIKDLILWKVFNYEKLRYNIKLNKSSIVFDGGGFDGEYSSVFNKKYKCKIFIFEPLPEFCRKIELRFKNYSNIKVINKGLSNINGKKKIIFNHDKSGLFFDKDLSNDKRIVEIKVCTLEKFCKDNQIKNIDLLKLNIEGSEYQVLEDLIKKKMILNFKNIHVQFHHFVPNAYFKYKKITSALQKTHYCIFKKIFIWEFYKMK